MPICFCRFAQCNGATISVAAFNNHRREDKAAMFRNAVKLTEHICRRQDDAIGAHLASRSRAKERSDNNAMKDQPSRLRTHQHMVHLHLQQLSVIEKEADDLILSTESRLRELKPPNSREENFPLSSSMASIRGIFHELSSIASRSPAVQEAKAFISDRLYSLMHHLGDAKKRWKKVQNELPPDSLPTMTNSVYDTGKHGAHVLSHSDPIIQVTIFTMVVLQAVLHVSRRGCRFLLVMIQFIVQLALFRHGQPLSIQDQKLLADFPRDPQTAVKQLFLDREETVYAVCPRASCQKLHAPQFEGSSPIPRYPLYCLHCEFTEGLECGTRLTRPRYFADAQIEVPIKRFISFSFKDYVASLTSRAGFEDYMDRNADPAQIPHDGPEIHDAFDGNFLRDFKGPDGKFFYPSSGSEGRYCFSLGFDFFNPFSNKQSGKKVSFGIIAVVCLNLPIHLRYQPENIFLAGVIPGPNEPPLTAVNHYLAPLIDEFLEFWMPGVRFSQTAKFPAGRLILCALILVICDLPAARKISGFASYTSEHFCNVCHCRLSKPGLQNTVWSDWTLRTDKEYRLAMDEYEAATTAEAREDKFRGKGIRCSELRRLPYFDMVDCVVVDPVHNHFLGLINEHFTNILGIRVQAIQEKPVLEVNFGRIPSGFSENTVKGIESVRNWLQGPFSTTFGPTRERGLKKLMRIRSDALEFICTQIRCPLPMLSENRRGHTKQDYCESILDWRQVQPEIRDQGATTSTLCGHVLKPEEMASIWSDMDSILTPSWMTSVPARLGQSAHGKLKADQWRILGTTHLPLSLIRLWALTSENDGRSRRCYEILRLTLSLTSAIIIAISDTITPANADAYLTYMTEYLDGIKRLFPEYKLKPNHHMSLHIHRYLLLFGPVHSWWVFPFERLVGRLQRIPNNGKVGEMEDTMARAYTRMSNLQMLLSKPGCPEAIQHTRPHFEDLFCLQPRDKTPIDSDSLNAAQGTERALPPDLRVALLKANISVPPRACLSSRITINDLTLTTSSTHPGNSCLMISLPGSIRPVPAQLVYIVRICSSTHRSLTFLGVRRHRHANITRDPYLCFPALKAQIWQAWYDELEIISPSQVVCHFACLPLKFEDQDLVVTMSLSRTLTLHDFAEKS